MNKTLKPDELEKIPEDGIEYRDFILQVASNNNWVFNLDEYSNAIVNAKKGALGRVSTTLKELEDDRFLIKRSSGRVYEVTTKGIKYFNPGITPEDNSVKDEEYNITKLNRTAEGIDEVESKVSRSSLFIAISSGISALAIVVQVLLSIFSTTEIHGEISILQRQQEIEQLTKELIKSIELADHLSYKVDSLKMELQKLSKK